MFRAHTTVAGSAAPEEKDLNLEENGLGGMKWKWAAEAGESS